MSYTIEFQELDDLSSRVDALEGLNTCGKDVNNLVDKDEVESIVNEVIDNLEHPSEYRVQDMIDQALSDYDPSTDLGILDEDDVRRIADEAISEADNTEVRDLERRFDRYAQKLDALIGGTQGTGTDTATPHARLIALEDRSSSLESTLQGLIDRVDRQTNRIIDLEKKLSAETGEALTLLDLLRRAYSIIVGR
jgi:hypothetical protein